MQSPIQFQAKGDTSALYQILLVRKMEFEHEHFDNDKEEELKNKKSIAFGFSAILESIANDKRSHHGYTKLEPEEPKQRDKVSKFIIFKKPSRKFVWLSF